MAIYTAKELLEKHGVKPSDVKTVSSSQPTAPTAEKPSELGNKLSDRLGVATQAIKDTATLKVPIQTGALRVAGAATGAVNDAIGAAISPAIESGVNALSDIPAVQQFAMGQGKTLDTVNSGTQTVSDAYSAWKEKHPQAALDLESAGNIAAFLPIGKGASIAKDATVGAVTKTGEAIGTKIGDIVPTAEQIAAERSAKIKQGFAEQNTRLKSADKAFTKNTIVRKTPEGNKVSITPIDTLAKYNVTPTIEKGSLQLGDYNLGTGGLGKIKEEVSTIGTKIDTKLKGTNKTVNLADMEFEAFKNVMKNPEFKLSGTVGQNVAKLEAKFKDFKNSYGDSISIDEINKMREQANFDFNPETQDISRILGDTARKYVYDSHPEVRGLLQKQGELLAAKKYAEAINGTKVIGGKIGNYAMRTAGAMVGSTVEKAPIIGPVVGMLGGEAASRLLQQSQFRSLWTELRALIAKEASQKGSDLTKVQK